MLEEKAALTIQKFFASYRTRKKISMQQTLFSSPSSKLLRAFDLRFQCMRAVAAAKFPINKPIEDISQVARVIASIRNLAKEKDIVDLDAIERLFHHNILLAERIQGSYYYLIWKKSYPSTGVDCNGLISQAYKQLCAVVQSHDLKIRCDAMKVDVASADVLGLAREIIQLASKMIIEALAQPQQFLNVISGKEFTETFEKMLAAYMTPTVLADSKGNVQFIANEIRSVTARSKL